MSERGYNPEEMMVVAASRFLEPDDVVFIGIGLPSKAANLARKTHAPDLSMIYESGTLDTKPTVLPLSIGDPGAQSHRQSCGVGAGDVQLLAAGRLDPDRLSRRRPDRPIRESQLDGHRRLSQTQSETPRRRRRAGDRGVLPPHSRSPAPEPEDLCRKARFLDHGRHAARGTARGRTSRCPATVPRP